MSWAQGPSAIVVKPAMSDAAKDRPFQVIVTSLNGSENEVRKITIAGSRSSGTTVTAWLNLRSGQGGRLTVPLQVDEGRKRTGNHPMWSVGGVTIDVHTAKECNIEIYIQPEGVAYDGGTLYRVPLDLWTMESTTKPAEHR